MFGSKGEGCINANSASVSRSKANIAVFSPTGSPTVLDQPVLVALNSDQKHTMVQWSPAVWKNTVLVTWPPWSINSYWNRPFIQSIGKIVAASNIDKSKNFEFTAINFASLIDSLIRILIWGRNTLISDIFESRGHVASVAALVSIWPWAII